MNRSSVNEIRFTFAVVVNVHSTSAIPNRVNSASAQPARPVLSSA